VNARTGEVQKAMSARKIVLVLAAAAGLVLLQASR
jgi:hypothetical protein